MEKYLKGLSITFKEKQWIDKKIEWLINKMGKDYLESKQNIALWDVLKKNEVETIEEFEYIVAFITKQMDITEKIKFFNIDSNKDHRSMISKIGFGSYEDNIPGGLYINESGEISIGIRDDLYSASIEMVAIIAHELCHLVLLHKMALKRNDEKLTDMLTVFFGFGFFSSYAYGYLNQSIYGYIMCSRDLLFGHNNEDFINNLPSVL